ncbi:MAG: hypothetical protein HY922_05340 [Elusimicrobia bacterium]|nr:hypothetical protein [Elusimicrobiota bacterium]
MRVGTTAKTKSFQNEKLGGYGLIILFVAVGIFAIPAIFSLQAEQIADSPDGQYRAFAGISSRGLTPAAIDFLDVWISRRNRFFGTHIRTLSDRIFVCSESNGIGIRWTGPRDLIVTSVCDPKSKVESPIRLTEYRDVKIGYEYHGDWRGEPSRGTPLRHP